MGGLGALYVDMRGIKPSPYTSLHPGFNNVRKTFTFKLACLALAIQAGFPAVATAVSYEHRLAVPKLTVSGTTSTATTPPSSTGSGGSTSSGSGSTTGSGSGSTSTGSGGTGGSGTGTTTPTDPVTPAPAPIVTLSSSALNFGGVPSGQTGSAAVVLTNTGTAPLSFGSAPAVSGDSAFSAQTNCSASLDPSASCSTTVTFSAVGGATHQGLLLFNTNARETPYEVGLTGTSLQATGLITPRSLTDANNFGTVPLGETVSRTFFFYNTGNTSASVHTTLQGNAGLTLAENNCGTLSNPATVVAAGACSITVSWTPNASGDLAGATLSVDGTFSGGPASTALIGSAVNPQAVLSTTTLDYGNVQLGTTSTKSIVLSNTGADPLTLTAAPTFSVISGYSAQTNCGAMLSVGASCVTNVTFAPQSVKSYPSSLTFATNSVSNPIQAVTLSGSGQSALGTLLVTPTSLNFGATVKGGQATAVAALLNTGTVPAALTVGAPNAPYIITGSTCGTSLSPNTSCTVNVAFRPTDDLSYTSGYSIPLTWGAGAESTAIPLAGTVLDASVTPSSVTFTSVALGTTSSAQTVQVANLGSAPMTISALKTDAPFAQTNTCGTLPATLAVGQSCSVSVTYTPTVIGSQTGTLTLTNNVTSAPQSVALTGGSTGGVVLNGSSRTWADGTYAASCKAYYTGAGGHSYSGATGDGAYRIQPPDGSAAMDVYCDMTADGGGWTLVTRGTPTGATQHATYTAGSAVNLAGAASTSGATYRMSDTQINAFTPGVYRTVVGGSYFSSRRFFSGSCSYSSTAAASTTACLSSYADPALTTGVKAGATYAKACGLSDFSSGTNKLYVASVECSGSGRSYSWFGGNGTAYGADFGTGSDGTNKPVTLEVWVR